MSGIKYTRQQQEELNLNAYVRKCSEKYIQFTDAFKIFCVKQSEVWLYHRDIFWDSGFPEYIIQWAVPKECLWNWKHAFKKEWWQWVISKKKGRKKQEKKDISQMTMKEENAYLKAEVAYLRQLQVDIHGKSP